MDISHFFVYFLLDFHALFLLEQEILGFSAGMDQGSNVHQERRKRNATKGKGSSTPGINKDQHKEWLDRRPTV